MDGGFACVGASNGSALIRRWRATFPLEGEGYHGDSVKFGDCVRIAVRRKEC